MTSWGCSRAMRCAPVCTTSICRYNTLNSFTYIHMDSYIYIAFVICLSCIYIVQPALVGGALAPRDAHRRAPFQSAGTVDCIHSSIYIWIHIYCICNIACMHIYSSLRTCWWLSRARRCTPSCTASTYRYHTLHSCIRIHKDIYREYIYYIMYVYV